MTKTFSKLLLQLSVLGRMAVQLPPQGLLPLVVVLVLWQILQTGNSPYFPPPSAWWNGLVQIAAGGKLFVACGATLKTIVAGLALAMITGIALGVLIGTSPRAARALGDFVPGI
jgi:ABC-type nitrate/sulfonate/bicarbonate transport system permease component